MARQTKVGSSRRKGDEYQDLTALTLALDAYIRHEDFELFIEYEKAGSLDDVVLVVPSAVDAYQIKHAVSGNAVYTSDDLTDEKSVVYLRKFAESWQRLVSQFSSRAFRLHLRSNRSLDAPLSEVVGENGLFDAQLRENRYRKEKAILRQSLKEASGLEETPFQDFLTCFHFDLKHPSWKELEEHIRVVLLDHRLGISDRRVFADLKSLVERHAIEIAAPITPALLDAMLQEAHRRYLLPQTFQVDKPRYVEPPDLANQLDQRLAIANSEYVVVTGPPGSGKSTALSEYFDRLEQLPDAPFTVVRYYCFVKVHDNQQLLRLEAKSLRVNLLNELNQVCPPELRNRRFDFGEDRLVNVLECLGKHFQEQGQKLIVFVDGLDHVERNQEIRESVLTALPAAVPAGVVFVIGTQELHHWRPLALQQGREERHIAMPLFSYDQTRAYVCASVLATPSEPTMKRLHERSGGLPLYLRYAMEIAAASDNPELAMQNIPAATNGDIHSYYAMLWSAFDADGRSDAKHVCAVLCSLPFSVHEGEIFGFQSVVPERPRFDEALRRVRHLLRTKNDLVSIFHNSFQVFVLGRTDASAKRDIAVSIISRLKDEQWSTPRWFRHAFRIAMDAGDFEYVLNHVHREFVDKALLHYRSEDEIMQSIALAVDAAAATNDLVALSRLGSLAVRTNNRLEFEFSWLLLTETLVYQGRIHDALDSIYAEETGRVLTGRGFAMGVALTLRDKGEVDLAQRLFDAVLSDRSDFDNKSEIVTFARCAGHFLQRVARPLRWLAEIQLQPEMLESEDFAPVHAPHLAAYLDSIVASGRDDVWRRLKRLNRPVANNLMRHLIIRAIAKHGPTAVLRTEIGEYVAAYPSDKNIELAFYAAKGGLPPTTVTGLAGSFQFPPQGTTDRTLRTELENHLRRLAYWATVFGYEGNGECARQVRERISHPGGVWSCAINHLLIVGELLGNHFAARNSDWYRLAERAIEAIESANFLADERTSEALDACRSVLPESLLWISSVLETRCAAQLDDWAKLLLRLRSSLVWTTHYGIGEQITNYSFEFAIWNDQATIAPMRSRLKPILEACACSYSEALRLKGGSRSHHFLAIASLAARCGFRTLADAWMKRGIETSLAYGYRKDTTLEVLIDVADILDKHQPERTLSNCAAILEMVKWVSSATDGRSTTHFAQHLFPLVVRRNRCAAFQLLRRYYERFAEWKAEECLREYIIGRTNGKADFLWALAALLPPNESREAREHIARIGGTANNAAQWQSRFTRFILTMVNPRHWPENVWLSAEGASRPQREWRRTETPPEELRPKTFQLDGESVPFDKIRENYLSSFEVLRATRQTLNDQNEFVSDFELIREAVPRHIDGAASIALLDEIGQFVRNDTMGPDARLLERLGQKYLALGAVETGLKTLEDSIERRMDYGEDIRAPLATLAGYDRERGRTSLIVKMHDTLEAPDAGFKMPLTAAVACDILGETVILNRIFAEFLLHCQELFAPMPVDHWFDELRDWTDAERDEKTQIVDLLVDRLTSPAIEAGNRLVAALCDLCESAGNDVLPTLVRRAAVADGVQLSRLLAIISWLGAKHPRLLQDHCEPLLPLLNRTNANVRLSLTKALRMAFENSSPPPTIGRAIEKVERQYASTISYRGFGLLHVEPSSEFRKLIRDGTTIGFRRKFATGCSILHLSEGAVLARLERILLDAGATVESEREETRDMWQAHGHAQGWPVISFFPDFEVKISEYFFEVIDEVLTKQSHSPDRVDALLNVFCPCDPEFLSYQVLPKPDDIAPLVVQDSEEWLAVSEKATVCIESQLPSEWLTIFEFRQLSQDDPYHVPHMMHTHVRSAFILPEIVQEISTIEASLPWEEDIEPRHTGENLTWADFQQAMSEVSPESVDAESPGIPCVAVNSTHPDFLGFHTLASFSSLVFGSVNLTVHGFDVFQGDERVGYFESWQEGYPDEDYNDRPMAHGVRFRARSNFIQQLCRQWGRAFAVREIERRWLFNSFQREPEKSRTIKKIAVFPVA